MPATKQPGSLCRWAAAQRSICPTGTAPVMTPPAHRSAVTLFSHGSAAWVRT